jgi:hypothetical protein
MFGYFRMGVNMEIKDALRKTYRLRFAVARSNSLEVTFPYEVAEREARKRNMTIETFIEKFQVAAYYGGSVEGVLYIFEEIA